MYTFQKKTLKPLPVPTFLNGSVHYFRTSFLRSPYIGGPVNQHSTCTFTCGLLLKHSIHVELVE